MTGLLCRSRRATSSRRLAACGLAAMCILAPVAAHAKAGDTGIDSGDTAWVLVSAALVLVMTPGLALFYAGMVRAKNVLSTIMHSLVAMALVTVLWAICGYSLAFAPGNALVGGLGWVGLKGVGLTPNPDYAPTIPHQAFMVFQLMFAIITPALISGAIADRMRFSAYVAFIGLWSLIVYAPMAHMVWGSGGLLRELGALDFAGGTVVHITSGASALVLAVLVGKRRKEPSEDMRPHSLPMTVVGTGLLWFGWFGFNAGSALGANSTAVSALVATHFAAAAAALAWVVLEWTVYGKPTALGLATGAVAGLVAITPASGFVGPMPALLIGALVSPLSFYAIRMKNRVGYDDALDVFGVHCIGGVWGALATGLFASTAVNPGGADGLFMGGGVGLLVRQFAGVAVALAVAVGATLAIGLTLRTTMGLRVAADEEDAGLDLTQHGESAYAGPATGSDESFAGGAAQAATADG